MPAAFSREVVMSAQSTGAAEKARDQNDKNARTVFKMRAQMVEQGRTQETLATTDNMTLHLKVYASGGENGLHTHPNEDHVFIIMQGTARYYDADGGHLDVGKHGGILLPAGAYYWFEAIGEEPLVLMRVGAKAGTGDIRARLNIQGEPMAGNSEENKRVPTVFRQGAFFE
jgi:mannose-6-phosphate isomerase-like protein (cupin superfamily)